MLLILQSCAETVIFFLVRHVAQPGSARSWGVRGRRFKSSRADQNPKKAALMAAFLLPEIVSHLINTWHSRYLSIFLNA